ncbi:glycerophosphodiester phosphodiesterase [Adhaeribacter aquaticus]|uniref:glycerophosphodiester phosphodiesterase n=1 Tax=Adhaeribacter aquaticus TaxID=299567 RepID=UPI000429D7BD|nr:glycerophosphodiester phosphodiesterase family protein [Adhaeribacter aquaticus]
MRKVLILVLFQMTLSILNGFGQSNEGPSVYLTNYTFSDKQPDVGYIKIKSAKNTPIKGVSIGGKHAKVFRVSKDNKLTLRKEAITPGLNWVDVVLTVKTTDGDLKNNFRIVRDQFIRNKVVAHRGAWKNTGATENSIAALKHAIDLGCEGSEFDVHMSADSVLYINHDPHIQDVSIAKSTSNVLAAVKLGNGEALPTLESYLKTGTGQNKTKLILELKPSELGKESSIAVAHKAVKMVEDLQAQAWVDYISFDYEVCKEIMKIAPYAKVAYLKGDKVPAELAQQNLFGLDYHFSILQKNPDWIKDAQQRKLTVNVWTVNDQPVMENLLKENVDFITTNEPELLLNLISAK